MSADWLLGSDGHEKRLKQNLFPVGGSLPGLADNCCISVKIRSSEGNLRVDDSAEVVRIKDKLFIRSEALSGQASSFARNPYILLFVQGSPSAGRCVVAPCDDALFDALASLDPPIVLAAYDLPPTAVTIVEAENIFRSMYDLLAGGDKELFGTNAEQFLTSPHIVVPLFAHVLSLSSEANIDFPLLLRTTAEQLRALLTDESLGEAKIHKIERNHRKFWSSVIGERIAFCDGGAARIAGLGGSEPLALRVGIYSVSPGETDLDSREDWSLSPYVLGDLVIDCSMSDHERPDRKRLQEAARYVLEPLTALQYLKLRSDVAFMFVHGPLVNQFTQYDEGDPNYIPCLSEEFLSKYELDQDSVEQALAGLPRSPSGRILWNQFMAVYGAVMTQVFSSPVPVAGVVERTAGRWLSHAVLEWLVAQGRITQRHRKKVEGIIERYEISDDFLFGCVLEEGEYLQPLEIDKNNPRRAREQWKEVVKQYPKPQATIIKTAATSFPYRVELNPAAVTHLKATLELLYHTSRLLPRYAFPVGLDIVDKYAKVPDWLSRGVSARIAADVLARALRTGDPKTVAQVRQFLAHTPRDFFYRPQP